MAWRILVPQAGIELMPLAVYARHLNHCTARQVLALLLIKKSLKPAALRDAEGYARPWIGHADGPSSNQGLSATRSLTAGLSREQLRGWPDRGAWRLAPSPQPPPALPSPLSHFQKGLRLPASQLLGHKSNQGRAGGTRQISSPGLWVAPDGCRLLPAQVLIRLGRSQGLREGGGAVRRALGCGPSPDSLSIVLPRQRRPSWTPERGRFLWLELLPVEEEGPRVLEPAGSYEPGATHMW